MRLVRFAIDERAYLLDALDAEQVARIIRTLLWSMREVDAAGHDICYDPDFIEQPIWGGITFWELFYSSELSLSMDELDLAAAQFSKAARWDETGDPQPVDVEVSVAGAAIEISGAVAWTHAQASRKLDAAACLSNSAHREMGRTVVIAGKTSENIWFVENAAQIQAYFRDLLTSYAQSSNEIERLSCDAFPNLDFAPKSFNGIKSMSKPVVQLAPVIVHHLGVLSDYGTAIFSEPWQKASAQFGVHGVNISDENGNTKQNATARKQRTIWWNEEERVCWWHTKLERDRDRIHLDPTPVRDGMKIIVGIFCSHFDT